MRNAVGIRGDVTLPHVRQGNLMATRTCLLLYLARARGCSWVVEQPRSSLLHCHPRFQQLFGTALVYRTHVVLGAYNAPTRKPLYLLSNDPWIDSLSSRLPKAGHMYQMKTYKAYVDHAGRKRVCGGKHLKASQTYPRKFGREVARQWAEHARSQGGLQQPTPLVTTPATRKALKVGAEDDMWPEAELTSVEHLLRGA